MAKQKKLEMSDIFVKGFNLEEHIARIKNIDFNSPEMQNKMAECREEQEKTLERKDIDWNRLANTYITI
ncbi:MAG: hypothetical protein NTW62_03455 [Candidatus Nomurabacteria bacterium]|nr:hypothetical protein [Candidatus Nomurabacteria bacterium]